MFQWTDIYKFEVVRLAETKDALPIYLKIYQRIKEMIHEGGLPKGSKLPSIRQASVRHGVSTTTMEHAYNQLMVEGYILSVAKKGYFVEASSPSVKRQERSVNPASKRHEVPQNLSQTPDMFDPERFRKIMNEVLSDDPRIYDPCHPDGEWALRTAIASHLRSEREVLTHPESVLVTSGIQQLILRLGTFFSDRAVIAYLKPGFKRALDIFRTLGFTLEGCETIDEMLRTNPDLIYVSPSNQYPSGKVMPINERMKIIRHANSHDAFILEDDYNHLFRYNAYQIPPLHSLSSKQRVIYIGSFSRNTLVSLRMSYMVLPTPLLRRYDSDLFAQTVSKPEQLAMARFIHEGHYRRHLKRLSKVSKRKNDALKSALEPFMDDDHFEIYGLESNMHFVIRLDHPEDKTALTRTLDSMAYAYRTFEERPLDVLIPYSGIPSDRMDETMRTLFEPIVPMRLS